MNNQNFLVIIMTSQPLGMYYIRPTIKFVEWVLLVWHWPYERNYSVRYPKNDKVKTTLVLQILNGDKN